MKDIPSFLIETFRRLGQKSPVFFRVWGRINVALLLLGGVPSAMQYLQETFAGVIDFSSILPTAPWVAAAWKICIVMGVWGKIMSSATVTSNHEIVQDDGTLIQRPCEDLPFTEKKEGMKLIEPKQV